MTVATYETVNPTRRWEGSLETLWPALRAHAYRLATADKDAKDAWWWYMLPSGLVIACRVQDDFRKSLRVSRRYPVAPDAWEAEVQAVLAHCTIVGRWLEVEPEGESEAAHVAQFVELRSNEHAPGLARCHDCGRETPSAPITVPMRCEGCRRVHRLRALPDYPDRHAAIIGER